MSVFSNTWAVIAAILRAMRLTLLLMICAVFANAAERRNTAEPNKEGKKMKITSVLVVEEIEKSLPFWVDRMGFTKVMDVPDGDRLGFVMLVKDGAELMMQTLASIQKDEPKAAPKPGAHVAFLFIEVTDFDDVLKRLAGYPILMPERTTFYGMREIGVVEPGGHNVTFAVPVKK